MHLKDPIHVLAAAILAGCIIVATKRPDKKPIPTIEEISLAIEASSTAIITISNPKNPRATN